MLNEPSGASDVQIPPPAAPRVDETRAQLRAAVEEVFFIESEADNQPKPITVSFFGHLTMDSEAAYDKLDTAFKSLDHVPILAMEGKRQVVRAIRGRFYPKPRPTWPNVVLFVLTLLSLLYTGASGEPGSSNLAPALQILRGLPYAVGMMLILASHEFGHYFAARYHKVAVTLPYFIPLPFISPLGTMGAFIQLREPMRNRRVLLDVGAAGPLAGLIVAIPILLIGLKTSPVRPSPVLDLFTLKAQSIHYPGQTHLVQYGQEGNSLLYLGAKLLVFGRILPDGLNDVSINQLTLAGWAGLLVTALNLIPNGQLDGGHTLFSLIGERARMFYLPLLALVGLLALNDSAWLLWVILLIAFGRIYATPLDMITPLDRRRRVLAIVTLVVFVLVFMPTPLQEIAIGPLR
jgi:membrane-associated protease RseP (regulator of RpoE activity)